MGKRKSTKPQKYVQQSDEEDDDHLEFYDVEVEEESKASYAPMTVKSELDSALWNRNVVENNLKQNRVGDEKPQVALHQSEENKYWPSNFKLNIVNKLSDDKYVEPLHHRLHKVNVNSSPPVHNTRTRQNHTNQTHLESLLADQSYVSSSFPDERLNDSSRNLSMLGLSGTESDRKSAHDYDHRESRPKRRRKYVTYPATFRLEVVECAEKNGKSAAAKKYNICVEKVSMWCKTKDNIVHKVRKGGVHLGDGLADGYDDRMDDMPELPVGSIKQEIDYQSDDTMKEMGEEKRHQISKELEMLYDDSDASEKYEYEHVKRADIVFCPAFKLRVVKTAEEKGEKVAAKEYLVCERRVHVWFEAKDVVAENASKQNSPEWECDLYVKLKSLLDSRQTVTVREILWRAEQAQRTNPSPSETKIDTLWLTTWCRKFNVLFSSSSNSTPQPLTEDACLILETSRALADSEEVQALFLKEKKSTKVQEIIDSSRKIDASASASDREDSFSSFSSSNKRRRRSYTLAFKLEVVKFAQSHTKHATSRKYGIARRVISRWIADKEVLQNDLMNATQQVLGDTSVADEVDTELLSWYKEMRKRGSTVTKDMVCTKARSLFISMGQSSFNASSDWFKHWSEKWKKCGELLDFEDLEENNEVKLSSAMVPSNKVSSNHQNSGSAPQSSLQALKEVCMTNSVHNSTKPTSLDLTVNSNFPELLSAIHRSPSSSSANSSLKLPFNLSRDCNSNNLLKACGSSLQAAINYCSEIDKGLARTPDSTVSHNSILDDRKKIPQMKKRRERYSPEFKLTVIDYASSHSYQETSRKFGVHHITVSEWCKDKERIKRKVYCENLQSKILKSETAEQKFLSWIQDCNKHKVIIKPTDVQSKANEILNIIGEAEVKKNCWWFYLWNKRGLDSDKLLDDETDLDLLEKDSRVNYPPAVKIEIARVAERQSVNSAARCFRVARKRIREWVKSKEKLRWLAETGQVRERSVGKKISLDADKEVYDWFRTAQDMKPNSTEIRSKALEIFHKHGFNNMKRCSKDWYKNWCKRFGILANSEIEDKLIKWVLTKYDENVPINNQELRGFVGVEMKKDNEEISDKSAADCAVSFCKKFPKLLKILPGISETLPADMETEISKFRQMVQEVQEETNFSLSGVGCMDEIPLSFITCDSKKKVVVNCDLESSNVVVILTCLADGGLLPPVIVLKEHPPSTSAARYNPYVVYKEQAFVDEKTLHDWLQKVWLTFVPSPSLLIMDCFKPHVESVLQETMSESGVTPVIIPEGCSCKLQPVHASGIVKKFRAVIQESWSNQKSAKVDCSSSTEDGVQAADSATPSDDEIIQWVLKAHSELESHKHLIRRSFIVTGISLAPDHSEDSLVGNAEWFGLDNNEHILSPASTTQDDSDLDT